METRNLDIADYLNIWRGALYSVIIGMFIKQFIDNDPSYLYCWVVFIMITIYVILDSSVRFYSRFLLRKTYLKTDEKEPYYLFNKKIISFSYVEFLLFALEIVGLIIIAFGIQFIQKDGKLVDFQPNDIIFSFFLLTVILHNSIQIGIASTDITLFSYIKKSIIGDALEIDSIRENWQQKYEQKIEEIKKVYQNIAISTNDTSKITEIEEKASEIKSSSKSYTNKVIKYHILAQFSALHIIILNTVFLILLFFKTNIKEIINIPFVLIEKYNVLDTYHINHLTLIIVTELLVFIILSYILYKQYKKVAEYELLHIKKHPQDEISFRANNNGKKEKTAQLIGNIALILSLISLYLTALIIGNSIIYIVIFLQQMFISLYIIRSNK